MVSVRSVRLDDSCEHRPISNAKSMGVALPNPRVPRVAPSTPETIQVSSGSPTHNVDPTEVSVSVTEKPVIDGPHGSRSLAMPQGRLEAAERRTKAPSCRLDASTSQRLNVGFDVLRRRALPSYPTDTRYPSAGARTSFVMTS